MKIYILLFFIPFLAASQSIHKFQSEVFTCKSFADSTNTEAQINYGNKSIDANQGTTLETVVINSERNYKIKKYGFYKRSFFRSLFNFSTYSFSNDSDPAKFGVYIEHPETDKKILIKGVLLRAWSKNASSLATIRVHLYPIDRAKKIIGHDLLKKEHSLQLDTDISLKTIDVSDEQIPFPKTGFLIAVEKVGKAGEPVVQGKKSNSGSNSYYIDQKVSKDSINLTPLGGINRDMQERLGLEQQDFMIGVSAYVRK